MQRLFLYRSKGKSASIVFRSENEEQLVSPPSPPPPPPQPPPPDSPSTKEAYILQQSALSLSSSETVLEVLDEPVDEAVRMRSIFFLLSYLLPDVVEYN